MNTGLPAGPVSADEKNFGMLAHLLAIFTNFIGPLVIWLVKKDESAFVDRHGKEALNFQISVMIYCIVSSFLVVFLIGILLLTAVSIMDLVCCIIAAIKASNGEEYSYPLSIRFVN